jgi:hypothetical protein
MAEKAAPESLNFPAAFWIRSKAAPVIVRDRLRFSVDNWSICPIVGSFGPGLSFHLDSVVRLVRPCRGTISNLGVFSGEHHDLSHWPWPWFPIFKDSAKSAPWPGAKNSRILVLSRYRKRKRIDKSKDLMQLDDYDESMSMKDYHSASNMRQIGKPPTNSCLAGLAKEQLPLGSSEQRGTIGAANPKRHATSNLLVRRWNDIFSLGMRARQKHQRKMGEYTKSVKCKRNSWNYPACLIKTEYIFFG